MALHQVSHRITQEERHALQNANTGQHSITYKKFQHIEHGQRIAKPQQNMLVGTNMHTGELHTPEDNKFTHQDQAIRNKHLYSTPVCPKL